LWDGKIIYSKGNDHIIDSVSLAMLIWIKATSTLQVKKPSGSNLF
jgi:hypothetical protein